MSTLENNRSIEDQINELKALIKIEQAEGSIVAEMGFRSRLEMLQEELMSREKYNPAEKFGGPAYEYSAELSEMIQNGTLEVDQGGMKLPKELKIYASGSGSSQLTEGIEDLPPPVDVKVYQDLIENMSDDLEEPYQYVDAYGTDHSKVSNFKRAVSWILHSEELDTVKEVFGLDDQQMADAVAVVEMFNRIEAGAYQDGVDYIGEAPKFDMLNEVHKWSKK